MSNRTTLDLGLIRASSDPRLAIRGILLSPETQPEDETNLGRWCRFFDQSNPSLAEDFYRATLNALDAKVRTPYEKCLVRSWRYVVFQRCQRKKVRSVRHFLEVCEGARAGSRLERLAWRQALIIARKIKNPAGRYICLSDVMATKEELGL